MPSCAHGAQCYFYERAPECYVIAAGSLLGVALGRGEYSYPVGRLTRSPCIRLDFEEFLWASGEEKLASLIEKAYASDALFGLQ